MNVTFKKNMAVEMLCCVRRYSNDGSIKKLYSEMSLKRDDSIDEYIEAAGNAITSFIDSELKSLFGICSWNTWILSIIAIRNNIEDCRSLMEYIQKMDPEEFLSVLNMDFQISLNKSAMRQCLQEHFDEKNIEPIIHMYENMQETLERMHYALKKFNDYYFTRIIEDVSIVLDKKLQEHKQLYETLDYKFINAISGVDEKTMESGALLVFHISYFMDANTFIFDKIHQENDFDIIYGYQMEQRLSGELASEKRKQLFKALSDEKRVEIIKLLSKRSWYGNELAKHLGITTATLSYHISRLFDIDVITFEEGEKNRFYYKLEVDKLKSLFDKALEDLLGEHA